MRSLRTRIAVLDEHGEQPLLLRVRADAEVEALCVALDIGQRDLVERLGRRREDGELCRERTGCRTRCRRRRMWRSAMLPPRRTLCLCLRPRQRVRELRLPAEDVRVARFANRERRRSGPGVLRRRLHRLELRDRIAVEVLEARLVEHGGAQDRGLVDLRRPRVTGELTTCARQRVAGDHVLRVRVVETIEVHARHDAVRRRELVVHASIEERLTVLAEDCRARRPRAAR